MNMQNENKNCFSPYQQGCPFGLNKPARFKEEIVSVPTSRAVLSDKHVLPLVEFEGFQSLPAGLSFRTNPKTPIVGLTVCFSPYQQGCPFGPT